MRAAIGYTFLSNTEKAVTFLFPIIVLQAVGVTSYTTIEYIFALAAIAAVIFDLGYRSYVTYATLTLKGTTAGADARQSFRLVSSVLALAILCTFLLSLTYKGLLSEIVAGCARALFIACVAVESANCRLDEKPSSVFYRSLPVNLALVCAAIIAKTHDAYFIETITFIHLVGSVFVSKIKPTATTFGIAKQTTVRSLRYAWPTLASLLIFAYISSYGRIYGALNMSERELYIFSLAQRFALITQIAHSTYIGFYLKNIYESNTRDGIILNAIRYISIISAGTTIGLLAICAVNYNSNGFSQQEAKIILLLFIYTFVWCAGSYIEIYHNRSNKNINVLIGMLIWLIIFHTTLLNNSNEVKTASDIATAMLIGALANLTFSSTMLLRISTR